MKLMDLLAYNFRDPFLLEIALTHSSARKDYNYERLEFLGDAVIDLLAAERLYTDYPNDDEGQLSRRRSRLVSEPSLAEVARRICLNEFIVFGRSEELGGGKRNDRLLASSLEAIFGAIWLDGGPEAARAVFSQLFAKSLLQVGGEDLFFEDHKSRLQEKVQKEFRQTPKYTLIDEGEAGSFFRVAVSVGDRTLGYGEGRNKKEAEQKAAEQALSFWDRRLS
ncbi:MAG: ribonuclease III [Bdellovibrionaceae bacterium]|nr:ribonuclease III [Pseudobdellovibrionaceae bacterium]